MPKFRGTVGLAILEETSPGVWTENITERIYRGDILRLTKNMESAQQANDNIRLRNQVSIVADPYITEHIGDIKYVVYKHTKWKVNSVELNYPRLMLEVGGVYHGDE